MQTFNPPLNVWFDVAALVNPSHASKLVPATHCELNAELIFDKLITGRVL
jgi:hypothetical protein